MKPWLDTNLAPNGVAVMDNFARWFGGSKAVDAQGLPLVVFHGTASSFSAFDPKKVGSNYRNDDVGFFFTSNPNEAKYAAEDAAGDGGGNNIMPVYLSLQNPVQHSTKRWASEFFDVKGAWLLDKAIEDGNDGVIINGDGGALYIALSPSSIKSAIGNTGLYLKDSGDLCDHQAALQLQLAHAASRSIGTGRASRERAP